MENKASYPSPLTLRNGLRQTAKTEGNRFLTIVLFVSFLSVFWPASYALPNRVMSLWINFGVGVCAVSTLLYVGMSKITLRWLLFVLMTILIFILFPIANESPTNILKNSKYAIRLIGFVSLFEHALPNYRKVAIRAFLLAGGLMLAIHFASVILYFDVVGGMNAGAIQDHLGYTRETDQHWYFLTYDNASVFYLFPVVATAWLYGDEYSSRSAVAFGYILLMAFLTTFVLQYAITAIISSSILLAWRFVLRLAKRPRVSPLVATVLGLAFSLTLVFLAVGSSHLEDISTILRRGSNFASRGQFWDNALLHFFERPFWGNGYEAGEFIYPKIGQSHCHSITVETLFSGGIFAFSAFLGYLIGSVRRAGKGTLAVVSSISISVVALFIAGSIDWLINLPIPLALFSIAAHPMVEKSDEVRAEDTLRCDALPT